MFITLHNGQIAPIETYQGQSVPLEPILDLAPAQHETGAGRQSLALATRGFGYDTDADQHLIGSGRQSLSLETRGQGYGPEDMGHLQVSYAKLIVGDQDLDHGSGFGRQSLEISARGQGHEDFLWPESWGESLIFEYAKLEAEET